MSGNCPNFSKTIVKPTINDTLMEGGVPNPEETPKQKPSEGEVCCFLKCLLIFRFYYKYA